MKRRLATGIVAAIAAVSTSVPAAGVANMGGHPHMTPPNCGHHKHNGKHKGKGGNRKGSGKGNKCGR
jgi:hypothetical protein